MRTDKIILLLVLQLFVLIGLAVMDFMQKPQGIFHGVLLAGLCILTGIFLVMRIRLLSKMQEIRTELKRTAEGNVNIRLLANDGPILNEVIFSINELIDQLDKLQVQTMKSEAARKSLLSNISHDIRTPLTSIIGYLDAVQDDIAASKEEKQEYIEIISKKAMALKELIDDIFHLAKLDADEITLQPETIDFAEFVREAVIDFLPELKKADMELKVSIPEDKCLVEADRLSLLRITNNIINNALQHGKQGKVLGVELSEHSAEYHLSVWDKGAGISEDELTKVFERMYRTERSRSPLHGGSGLGLAIAKALVEKNEGRIWVESEPGIKTAFTISIPKKTI